MAERLLELRFREATGMDDGLRSVSAGTGDWHLGEDMNPPAARELLRRGADATGFTSSQVNKGVIAEADLVLVAGWVHRDVVSQLAPEAANRLFVLRQFGRVLDALHRDPVALSGLPDFVPTRAGVAARGKALVALAAQRNKAYSGDDELADPWGRGEEAFVQVADQIEEVVAQFVRALVGK